MPDRKLAGIIRDNKGALTNRMRERMNRAAWSEYQEFILRTNEGQRRIEVWLDLLVDALNGRTGPFFKDQERIGFSRAKQGFDFQAVALFYETFHETLGWLFQSTATSGEYSLPELLADHQVLQKLLFQGYALIGTSFLETRQQQVEEQVSLLQSLHDFTKEIIVTWDKAAISRLLIVRILSIFGAARGTLSVVRDKAFAGHYGYPAEREWGDVRPLVERSWREGRPLFMDEAGAVFTGVDHIGLKRLVVIPVRSHEKTYGIVSFADPDRGFRFGHKELELLNHFLNITALALENTFTLEEIELKRRELRLLTGRMITFREEERRLLAADIHDTLAQDLSGMSYKIQYCREMVGRDPDAVTDLLNGLLNTVRQAIGQSRELISSLHPEIIDTIGLVAALKRLIKTYTRDTGINVSAQLPSRIELNPATNICLFRVAQEALTNVHKHGHTERARISLERNGDRVRLVVADRGRGFDTHGRWSGIRDPNRVGLAFMRERLETIDGTLIIDSSIGSGCRIEAEIPVPAGTGECVQDQGHDR